MPSRFRIVPVKATEEMLSEDVRLIENRPGYASDLFPACVARAHYEQMVASAPALTAADVDEMYALMWSKEEFGIIDDLTAKVFRGRLIRFLSTAFGVTFEKDGADAK